MSRPCQELQLLIGRPASMLSDASRLLLERHLSECEDCRRAHLLARSLSDLVLTANPRLREPERERAIAGAFARVAAEPPRAAPQRRGVWLAVGAAAAMLILSLGVRSWTRPTNGDVQATQRGALASKATSTEPGTARETKVAPTTSDGEIDLTADRPRQFAHAQVVGAPGTRVRFDEARRELTLLAGRVEVAVDPRVGASFAVLTRVFRVQVLGTEFVVTPKQVDVRHGRVQVVGNDGALLAAELGAGERYTYATPSPTPTSRARPRPVAPESVDVLLQDARASLASADVQTAHALLQRASRLARSRNQRAELGTLNAECALLERQTGSSIRAYRAVAEQYRELPAGENALFAAAQLSAQEHDLLQARQLLESYLTRYPQGRFAEEARARLARLAR